MSNASLIPAERIERRILLLRGQKVLLDSQLAELYEVDTKALNQAVKRNIDRFPEDFMFQLSEAEMEQVLRSQIVTSSWNENYGCRRFLPFAFTEQFKVVFEAIRELMETEVPEERPPREIGFHVGTPTKGVRSRLGPRKRIT